MGCSKIPEGQRHLARLLPETSSSLVSFSAVHPRQLEKLVLRVCWNLGALKGRNDLETVSASRASGS